MALKGAVLLEAFTDALIDATPFVDTGDIGADLRWRVAGAVKLCSSVPPFETAYAGILPELHDDRLAQQLREELVDPRVEEAMSAPQRPGTRPDPRPARTSRWPWRCCTAPSTTAMCCARTRTRRRSPHWWTTSCGRCARRGTNTPARRTCALPG
ncbi:hypothetical protein SBADM41S_07216 [Streptomyces badius]